MNKRIRCQIKRMVIDLQKPSNWIATRCDKVRGLLEPKDIHNSFDNLPREVAYFLEEEFLAPDSPRIYLSISRNTLDSIKSFFSSLFWILFLLIGIYSVYQNIIVN